MLVDYAGPNVAKAMHVGHLRATIIGDSLARLFALRGNKVIRDPHFGDWGLQMGLVIAEIERRHPDLPYFDPNWTGPYPTESPVTLADLQEIYPASAARAETDPDWAETGPSDHRRPPARTRRICRAVATHEAGLRREPASRLRPARGRVRPLVWRVRRRRSSRTAGRPISKPKGIAEESRGALIIRVDEPGDNRELPPLILETSVGGYLYSTTDLATIELRRDLGAELVLYVVDARQSDHFELVFRAARKAGIAPDWMTLEHIRFGTMNGKDGKPFKTRAGGVVGLSDLIDLIEDAARTPAGRGRHRPGLSPRGARADRPSGGSGGPQVRRPHQQPGVGLHLRSRSVLVL